MPATQIQTVPQLLSRGTNNHQPAASAVQDRCQCSTSVYTHRYNLVINIVNSALIEQCHTEMQREGIITASTTGTNLLQ